MASSTKICPGVILINASLIYPGFILDSIEIVP